MKVYDRDSFLFPGARLIISLLGLTRGLIAFCRLNWKQLNNLGWKLDVDRRLTRKHAAKSHDQATSNADNRSLVTSWYDTTLVSVSPGNTRQVAW